MELQTRYAYSGTNIEYIGEAAPGVSLASAKWRIKKLTYSGTSLVISAWANGTDAFDKVWSQRATYTYITT